MRQGSKPRLARALRNRELDQCRSIANLSIRSTVIRRISPRNCICNFVSWGGPRPFGVQPIRVIWPEPNGTLSDWGERYVERQMALRSDPLRSGSARARRGCVSLQTLPTARRVRLRGRDCRAVFGVQADGREHALHRPRRQRGGSASALLRNMRLADLFRASRKTEGRVRQGWHARRYEHTRAEAPCLVRPGLARDPCPTLPVEKRQ